MFTKQDLDNVLSQLSQPVICEPVTICGSVCYSPEDIVRLGIELAATDPIKFEEYQQLMDDSFKKSLGI